MFLRGQIFLNNFIILLVYNIKAPYGPPLDEEVKIIATKITNQLDNFKHIKVESSYLQFLHT